MVHESDFHTQKGYELAAKKRMTAAMEDYLEMICRLSQQDGYTRIHNLAHSLNVKPSSASKMVDNLKALNLVCSEKYGIIQPTESGLAAGNYLLYRHNLLNRFLCYINHSEDELQQVERIEHFINEQTIANISLFLEKHQNK